MKYIKYLTLLIVYMFLLPLYTQAQDQDYQFVYVAHEIGSHRTALCEKLKKMRSDALETGDKLVIYLSTGNQDSDFGLFSLTNIDDPKRGEQNSNEAFQNIIAMIQGANSLPIVPSKDKDNIVTFFNECDFRAEDGALKCNNFIMDFYVGSRFWRLGFNNTIIAHLYSILDIPSLPKGKFRFRVFIPKSDENFKYTEGKAFGEDNIQNINTTIKINRY